MSPEVTSSPPLLTNDAIVCGIIVGIVALIFYTGNLPHTFWRRLYAICPKLLLCYFLPAILSTIGLFSAEQSNLYIVASRYFLPASLVLLILPTDLREVMRLGSKAVLVFLAGTLGVVLGGPVVLLAIKSLFPKLLASYSLHDMAGGLSTIAGSWIGGGANQTAMKEVFGVRNELFSLMLTTDVAMGTLWLMLLLFGVKHSKKINQWMGADDAPITQLKKRMMIGEAQQKSPLQASNVLILSAVGLFVTALGHLGGDFIAPAIATSFPSLAAHSVTSSFFWVVIIATTGGLLLSLTPMRRLEQAGASELGTAFLYFLVATLGMGMDLLAPFRHPEVLLIGLLWMGVHISAVLIVARIVRAPFFFIAVGSQANIGGAASAPIIAAAFHPSLASMGILLAVLGYTLGTYAAYFCGLWMQWLAG